MAASEYEPERLVEAVEELQRRAAELRDLAGAWETSLREEAQAGAVPGVRPASSDLPGAYALHGALSTLAYGIRSGLRDYEQHRPKGDLTAFKKWVKTRAS